MSDSSRPVVSSRSANAVPVVSPRSTNAVPVVERGAQRRDETHEEFDPHGSVTVDQLELAAELAGAGDAVASPDVA
ncbi:MAG TPA: hypothetical protein VFX99_06540, partial [Microbacterium sp.]|nr:hypothetical protein [Microbacterium sp.]